MVLSSRGVSLPLFVSRTVLTVLNRKGSALTPNVNLTFYELSDGNVVGDGVFAVLVHLLRLGLLLFLWAFLSSMTRNIWSPRIV